MTAETILNFRKDLEMNSELWFRIILPYLVKVQTAVVDSRASDFFLDWWAEVTHGAKNGASFSEMMGPSISN